MSAISAETRSPPVVPQSLCPATCATSFTPDNSASGTALKYETLTSTYKTATIPVPSSNDQGRVLSGLRISPPTYAAAFHPLYANDTKISTTANAEDDQNEGLNCVKLPAL